MKRAIAIAAGFVGLLFVDAVIGLIIYSYHHRTNMIPEVFFWWTTVWKKPPTITPPHIKPLGPPNSTIPIGDMLQLTATYGKATIASFASPLVGLVRAGGKALGAMLTMGPGPLVDMIRVNAKVAYAALIGR